MAKLTKLTAKIGTIIFPMTLFSIYLPTSSAWAFNQFDVCVDQMVGSGVTAEKAGTACADALIPKELSRCVDMIRSRTVIDPNNALAACYRVRRPVDLANCVVDIDHELLQSKATLSPIKQPESLPSSEPPVTPVNPPREGEAPIIEENPQSKGNYSILIAQAPIIEEPSPDTTPILVALDSCRRSLLPGRYSECVTGLSRRANLSPIQAMNTCLDAQAYPEDIFPVYDQQ